MRVFASAALLLVASAILAWGMVAGSAAHADNAVNPLDGSPLIHGGTKAQRQLVRSIITGFAEPGFTEIQIGRAPRDYRRPGTAWLYVKIFITDGVDYALHAWHIDLLSGLYASEAITRGWRRLSGHSRTLVLPDGRQHFDSSGAFVLNRVDSISEGRVRELVEDADKASPLSVQSVSFDRPLGRLAVKIAAEIPTVDDLRGKWTQTLGEFVSTFANPPGGIALVEGSYVVIRDAQNRPLVASAISARTRSSNTWTSPAMRPRSR